MRVVRLYTPQTLAPNSELELDSDIRHYAVNVLRLNKNSSLKLFNGDGCDYQTEILICNKSKLLVTVIEQVSLRNESPLTTHLYLGISKSAHMDYAIQKTVEAGVTSIHPVLTERTVSKITSKSSNNKHQHWQRIIQSACEQSGRAVMPELFPISQLDEIKSLTKNEHGLMLCANANQTMNNLDLCNTSTIKLLIGAEGGFTKNESRIALEKGFQTVRCGPRILRTETAAVTAVILAQSLFGDLNT